MMHGGGGWHGGMRGAAAMDDSLGAIYNAKVVRRLGAYLKPHWRRIALGTLMMVVVALSNLAMPYLVKVAIDGPIAQGNLGGVGLVGMAYLAAALIGWGASYVQVVAMAVAAQSVLVALRSQMFDKLMAVEQSFYDRNEVGRIMSRVMNDVGTLQELLTGGILQLLSDILTLVGIMLVMLTMNLKLTLVSFVVIPVLIGVTWVWQGRARDAYRNVRATISVVNAGLQENISGVRVIQSLTRERSNRRRFDTLNERHLDANLQATRLSALAQPVVELISAIALAIVIAYGGSLVLGGELTAGALVAFALYVNRFFEPIRDLTLRVTTMQQAMASGERILEVIDTPVTIVNAERPVTLRPIRGDIVFDRVEFSYVPGVPVLRGLDLHIAAGQTVALVGQTGAGKSTIVNLVARFYDVTGGSIRIDGVDVRDIDLPTLRSQIGWVPQDPFLFSGTIRDNLRFGKLDATDAEIEDAARAIGAHEMILRLPAGYDTNIRERGNLLSAGQKQLLSFVRALLADPRILILDEATANIDTATEAVIQQGLVHLLKGRTSIVIAHRLSTVKNADLVVVLEHGQVVETGRHEELLQRGGAYYRLYTMTYAAVA
ncbi:MAG: lipid A ABC transporter permease/ATP-binding protein [Dehalococcoidia bacterium]|nr:MAG: lipid A ABC transporter permease/ATP-binding protein [Dehalococcoidia bacterium]